MGQGGEHAHNTAETMVEWIGDADDRTLKRDGVSAWDIPYLFIVSSPNSNEIGIVEDVVMCESGSFWLSSSSLQNYILGVIYLKD